jgi:hypothetical protein
MMRYVRAFFTALKLTLSGDIPQPTPLDNWMSSARQQLDILDKLAEQQGLDPQQVQVAIDRRQMPMATVVAIVRFHLTEEYPIMQRHSTADSLNYIYATNLDDHFRLTRLEAALPDSPLREAVTKLGKHLESIPRSEK